MFSSKHVINTLAFGTEILETLGYRFRKINLEKYVLKCVLLVIFILLPKIQNLQE